MHNLYKFVTRFLMLSKKYCLLWKLRFIKSQKPLGQNATGGIPLWPHWSTERDSCMNQHTQTVPAMYQALEIKKKLPAVETSSIFILKLRNEMWGWLYSQWRVGVNRIWQKEGEARSQANCQHHVPRLRLFIHTLVWLCGRCSYIGKILSLFFCDVSMCYRLSRMLPTVPCGSYKTNLRPLI